MQDTNAPKALQAFQLEYGAYLRDPSQSSLPQGVPVRRSEIYENLFFNNVCGFIDKCFPVAKSFFSTEVWTALCRSFFREWRSETPIFSQIPYEFVRFVAETNIHETLSPWMSELLHYEWVELEVDLSEADVINTDTIRTNPTLKLLAYQWPVHTISVGAEPTEEQQALLAVYRNSALKVTFLELNPMTFMLLQYIDANPMPLEPLLNGFAEHVQHPKPEELRAFAEPLLTDLIAKNILTGALL